MLLSTVTNITRHLVFSIHQTKWRIAFSNFSGVYNIFIKQGNQDVKVGCCENKGSFGELALMYNMPRAATIQSAGDGMLWAMDRQTFRRIVLRNAFQKRKMYESLLEKVPLLSSLNVSKTTTIAIKLVKIQSIKIHNFNCNPVWFHLIFLRHMRGWILPMH